MALFNRGVLAFLLFFIHRKFSVFFSFGFSADTAAAGLRARSVGKSAYALKLWDTVGSNFVNQS